jgi:lysophospholipase L1-like esterase
VSRRFRVVGVTVAAAAVAAGVGLVAPAIAGSHSSAGTAAMSHPAKVKPATGPKQAATPGSVYLALGDSVPFGYKEPNAIPTPKYNKPKTLLSWPQDVAQALDLKLANASCPGETTVSFMNTKGQSNDCENTYPTKGHKPVAGGYRTAYPLHVKYASKTQSQLAFGEAFLRKHPATRLVTLMIGANDGFICEAHTKDGCVSEIPALQKKITKNVDKILGGLRTKGHYQGQIVVALYYSTDYTSLIGNAGSQALNSALEISAKKYHAATANSYNTFKQAAATHKGSTCNAGLLTNLKTKPASCGVHLSPSGAAVFAQTVEKVVRK